MNVTDNFCNSIPSQILSWACHEELKLPRLNSVAGLYLSREATKWYNATSKPYTTSERTQLSALNNTLPDGSDGVNTGYLK